MNNILLMLGSIGARGLSCDQSCATAVGGQLELGSVMSPGFCYCGGSLSTQLRSCMCHLNGKEQMDDTAKFVLFRWTMDTDGGGGGCVC